MSKLWGGRFTKKTNKLLEEFSNSLAFDQKLARYDCIGSLNHIAILKSAKLLTGNEHKKLAAALKSILKSIENKSFFKNIDTSFEDIHSYIQHLVEKKAGKVGLKLHTCRSRNDQVAYDTKLYCISNICATGQALLGFQKTLLALAKKNKNVYVPGFTHLQHAIPLSLFDYISAYIEMFYRDEKRLMGVLENIQLTMGAGALAGTFIDSKHYSIPEHKIDGVTAPVKPTLNSIDAVSDRDFILDALHALSVIQIHLSRLSEDMILWASQEFDFINIDDAFCTGSSLMPQKKNPDIFELIRGYTGRLIGNYTNVSVMLKGLPLTYNRDMQHDKEPLFDSFEIILKELALCSEVFKNVAFNKKNIDKQLADECLYATDIADYLVKNKVAFKDAHAIVGSLVQLKFKTGINFVNMDNKVLKSIHPLLNTKILKTIVDPKTSVTSKKSIKKR